MPKPTCAHTDTDTCTNFHIKYTTTSIRELVKAAEELLMFTAFKGNC